MYAHRDWPGISSDERELVIAFLTRYVVGAARRVTSIAYAMQL